MPLRRRLHPQILFLHAGWAREYRGLPDDPPLGTFGYIMAGHEDAGEALNFRVFRKRCYGYAPHHSVDLRRLGGAADDEYVDGVLVIWTATDPAQGGRYVVGWYRNARVYSHMQELRPSKDRRGTIVEAAAHDCHLVPVDQRTFFIPSRVNGWPGISGAFFASEKRPKQDLDRIIAYVEGTPSSGFYADSDMPPKPRGGKGGWPSQDPRLRAKVETAAIDAVTAYYEGQGWKVKSVEEEKFGWDLDATNSGRLLHVEVKGRGGLGAVELTPREYAAMQDKKTRMGYRVAIVHNALTVSPMLTIFEYAPASDTWVCDTGAKLILKEMTGAIVSFWTGTR